MTESRCDNGQQITGPSPYVDAAAQLADHRRWLDACSPSFLGCWPPIPSAASMCPASPICSSLSSARACCRAVVVTIPIFIMYRNLGLHDTHLGLILLYTVFNLSFTVWLLKGFLDEIPREYEEAAMVDGYTRLQAFRKIVLPQAVTGIAATTVFSLIFAWNEYAFALMLTTEVARTAPPTIPTMLGRGGIEWSAIAAGTLGFLIPVVIVTFVLRKYLLRGVTFGAIRQ